MPYQIGIFGSAVSDDLEIIEKARGIGKALSKYDCVVLTGGTTGLSYEAAMSAKQNDILTIGLSPALNKKENVESYHFPADFDIMIYTGFGLKGRNILSVRSSDDAIILSGRIGTLNEFTIAYDEGKPIGVLTGTGGMDDEIKHILEVCKKGDTAVIFDSEPENLVDSLMKALEKTK